ncbi:MAG: CocE/NonD family hydrolase [Acidimicrobiales bacterium]
MRRAVLRRFGVVAAAMAAIPALLASQAPVDLGVAASATWAPPPAAYSEGSALNVGVTMADGTVIRADVYYPTPLCPAGTSNSKCSHAPAASPATNGFPVLLEQTPYGKQNLAQIGAGIATDVKSLVGQGYVVAISDVRGTGTSGGVWGLLDPVQGTDGATLVRWLANSTTIDTAVPGLTVNGQVGLFGESYMGIDQFMTVAALHDTPGGDPVKALFPIIAGNDVYRDIVTQGGIFNTEFSAAYVALVNGLGTANPVFDAGEAQYTDYMTGGVSASAFAQQVEQAPGLALEHSGSVMQYDVPTLANIETGGDEAYDAAEGFGSTGYWAQRNPVNVLGDVVDSGIATFLVGGWNDLFQRGELMNYVGLQNLAYDAAHPTAPQQSVTAPMFAGEPADPRYQLLEGPWTHLTAGSGSNLTTLEQEWFASWMGGPASTTTPLQSTTTPLHLYELGSGQWNAQQHTGVFYDLADWPPSAADASAPAATKYYFGPGAPSTSQPALSDNQGSLTTTAPTAPTGSDTVAYVGASNPCTLSSDQWGAGALAEGAAYGGSNLAFPCDTNNVTNGTGPGALSYTSAPMSSSQVIAGPIDVTVDATATTKESEWVATISEVSPSGQSVPLTTGALLGSFRQLDGANTWNGADGAPLEPFHPYTAASQTPVTPGAVTEYDLEVYPTFALVAKGWSIRLTLDTADTPHMVPTPSQQENLVGGIYQVQRNSIAASFVNLPLVPASTFSAQCPSYACISGGEPPL